jgi:putative endonuclease
MKRYYVYITTNPRKTTLYIGVTNDIRRRLAEHYTDKGNEAHFASKYHCYNLIFFEIFDDINMAISREKYLKSLSRQKKEALIQEINPNWDFIDILKKSTP